MSTLEIEEFKYLVVATGYTARLVKRVSELKEELLDEEENDSDAILYIEDLVWGKGLYEISQKRDEIEKIRKIITPDKYRGVIVLRCNRLSQAMRIISLLMEQGYCGCFDYTALQKMELIDKEILVMEFDCESG